MKSFDLSTQCWLHSNPHGYRYGTSMPAGGSAPADRHCLGRFFASSQHVRTSHLLREPSLCEWAARSPFFSVEPCSRAVASRHLLLLSLLEGHSCKTRSSRDPDSVPVSSSFAVRKQIVMWASSGADVVSKMNFVRNCESLRPGCYWKSCCTTGLGAKSH